MPLRTVRQGGWHFSHTPLHRPGKSKILNRKSKIPLPSKSRVDNLQNFIIIDAIELVKSTTPLKHTNKHTNKHTMKKHKKNLLTLSALAGLSLTTAQAAIITWDGGAGNDNWAIGTNWVGDTAPVDTGLGDSVILNTTGHVDTSLLGVDFTIQNNQSITVGSSGTELILEGSSSRLVVGDGGTLDIDFMRTRFANGGILEIEAGATTVSIDSFGTAAIGTLQFNADAAGVKAITSNDFTMAQLNSEIRYWNLDVNLTDYNVANGDIVLVDYATSITGTFVEKAAFGQTITFTSGWTADIDYAYDIGGGDLGIALINVAVPEPSSTTLLGLGGLALILRRRK